jgi:glycerophosphoryl diester phosphodiesterase
VDLPSQGNRETAVRSVGSCPLLLGHRGARPRLRTGPKPELFPVENTPTAFEYALAHGCDGFEFDVRFTRDRRAVLCHDPQLDGEKISSTDYSDLLRGHNELACLEDVLACFGDTAYLDIELKVSGHEEQVVAALRAKLPSQGHVISSFLPEVLASIHQLDAAVPLGFICDRPEYARIWPELPISVFIPQYKLVSHELVDAVHRRGLKLFAWTVNRRPDLLRLAQQGVDGLISDDPSLLNSTFLQSA